MNNASKFNPANYNILVVEDSKSINNILTAHFTTLGYNCFNTFSLHEAYTILEKETIHYAMLDINLPDGNGTEIIEKYGDTNLEFFVLSVEKNKALQQELYQKGILDFILKDRDFLHKVESVTRAIAQREKNRTKTILVVDDSHLIQEQLKELLSKSNYSVLVADDAITAGKIIQDEKINLILLDVELKNSNGIHFLRSNYTELITKRHIPIIIISGSVNATLIKDGLKAGAVDVIKKPFIIEELILKVDLWIDYKRKEEEIEQSTQLLNQYKDAVDHSAIVSKTDSRGIITYVNDEFCRVSGYKKEELLDNNHNIIRHKKMPKEFFKSLWKTIREDKEPWEGEIQNQTKTKETYWTHTFINPILDTNNNIIEYIAISNNISEHKMVQDYFKTQLHTSNHNLNTAMQKAKEYKRAMYESNLVSRTNLKGEITFVNSEFCDLSGYTKPELIGKPHNIIRHEDMPKELFEDLWRTIQNGLTWHGIIKNKKKNGESYWVNSTIVPIKDKQENIIEYMAIRSNVTSLFELHEEIEQTQKEIIYRMGEIGETRSNETGNHVKRVALYSKLLAELYSLDDAQCDLLFTASPMHDIGKVGIPDAILKKPAKLTDVEFEEMKKHAEIGYNILKCSHRKVLKAAAIISLQHHEKWNGKGYPQGLKGNDIHIFGRITALADVFDALSSERCYKKAWPDNEVFDYLEKEKGESFEPELVELFLKHKETFTNIRNKFHD